LVGDAHRIIGNYPAAPHLRRQRPAHVRKAHFAGRFLAPAALLNSYGSWFIVFSSLELDSYHYRSIII
jgi:hypothetical protein